MFELLWSYDRPIYKRYTRQFLFESFVDCLYVVQDYQLQTSDCVEIDNQQYQIIS